MHAKEIIHRYAAQTAVFQHKVLLISVNESVAKTSIYEATRYAWKISKTNAEQAEVILATVQGLRIPPHGSQPSGSRIDPVVHIVSTVGISLSLLFLFQFTFFH